MAKSRVLGFDVETTKFPYAYPWQKESKLVSVGLVDETGWKKTWVFNHDEADNKQTHREMLDEIQEIINGCVRLVGHNLKFDLNWLNYMGINYSHCDLWCTMVVEYLLRGQQRGGLNLAQLSKEYLSHDKIDKVKVFWDAGYDTYQIPLHILTPYLEQDCINTLAIYQKQVPQVREYGMRELVGIQCELSRVLSVIESNGMKFDTSIAENYIEKFEKELQDIDDELRSYDTSGIDLNLSSGDELSAYLYGGTIKRRELVWTTRTLKYETKYYQKQGDVEYKVEGLGIKPPAGSELKKKGMYSTDKNTIKFLKCTTKEQKRAVKLLLHRSEVKKALETFQGDNGAGLINKVEQDGCVHSKYNQAVAVTGRLSSSDPNGQNLPRKGTSPIKMSITAKHGYILVCDLSQIEWRGAAFLSQDPVMIQEILDGVDVHRENAITIFGANPDDKNFDDVRTTAKIVTFRLLYGGSAYGFYMDQKMPNYSLKKWEQIVAGFNAKYKVLHEWQQENIRKVSLQGGTLTSPTGRRFVFKRVKGAYSEKQIKNYPVQSLATADIMPLAMCVIYKILKDKLKHSEMIGQVHDSIIFDCSKDEIKLIAKTCIYVFENLPKYIKSVFGFDFNVPLTGDAEYGKNYGQVTKIKREQIFD